MNLSLAVEVAAQLTQIALTALGKVKAGNVSAAIIASASDALRNARLVTDMVAAAQAESRAFTEKEVATLIEMRRAALRELDATVSGEWDEA